MDEVAFTHANGLEEGVEHKRRDLARNGFGNHLRNLLQNNSGCVSSPCVTSPSPFMVLPVVLQPQVTNPLLLPARNL